MEKPELWRDRVRASIPVNDASPAATAPQAFRLDAVADLKHRIDCTNC